MNKAELIEKVSKKTDLTKVDSQIKIFVFGSVALNIAHKYSDLDIAVVISDDLSKKEFRHKFYSKRTLIKRQLDLIVKNKKDFLNLEENLICQSIQIEGVEIYPEWKLNGQ